MSSAVGSSCSRHRVWTRTTPTSCGSTATNPDASTAGSCRKGHTPLTAMVHLSAALLQAPMAVPLTPPADDAYWTLVAYHNNLRELGKSVTLAHDDIPARMSVIAEAEEDVRPLPDNEILELTSNVPAAEIPGRLELMQRRRGEKGAVSFVASTNMISVGVDVPRLGLMLVSGQPKTTSEYIQATSRVGRGKVDGLVVTMFSPTRARDRSHYESFVPYHSALYRAVEPTSVTPFAVPARNRALHAGLVVMARHARGWEPNDAASLFSATDAEWRELVNSFLARAAMAEPDEAEDVERHLRELESPMGRARARRGGDRRTQVLNERRTRAHRAAPQVRRAREGLGDPRLDAEHRRTGKSARERRGLMDRRTMRRAQVIMGAGPGAILDMLGESFVGEDTFQWRGRPRGHPSTAHRRLLRRSRTEDTHSG